MPRTQKPEIPDSSIKKIPSTTLKKKKPTKPKKETKPSTTPAANRVFGEADQIVLSQNEFFRFAPNPVKVGHLVLQKTVKNGKSVLSAAQYPAPIQKDSDRTIAVPDEFAPPPLIRPLEHIEQIESYGQTRFRAKTPDGTEMFATRSEPLEIDGEEATLAFFSPLPPNSKTALPFWGSEKKLEFFKPKVSAADQKACLSHSDYCTTLDDSVHKQRTTVVDYPSVHAREGEKRSMTQNKVMDDRSACQVFEDFYHEHEEVMSDEMAKVFKGSYQAPLREAWGSQKRPEWLHINAHSLMPQSEDPQVPENLGSAPKWANSKMMIPERTAKWYAFNRPDSQVKLEGDFTMLHGTDIAKDIQFNVTFTENGKTVQMKQHLNPLAPYPVYSTGSDIAQSVLVTHSIHQQVAPSIQIIAEAKKPVQAAAATAAKPSLKDIVFPSKKSAQAYLAGPKPAEWKVSTPKKDQHSFKRGKFQIPDSIDPENYLSSPSTGGLFDQFNLAKRKARHLPMTERDDSMHQTHRRVVFSSARGPKMSY